MIDRNTMRIIESLASRTGSNMQRLDALAQAMLMLLQAIFSGLVTIERLWANGGSQAVAATDGDSDVVDKSQYRKAFWLVAEAVFEAFMVSMKLPLGTLHNLAVTDGQGNLVLDAEGNPIYPYRTFDPAGLVLTRTDGSTVDYAVLSIEQVAYTDMAQIGVDDTVTP